MGHDRTGLKQSIQFAWRLDALQIVCGHAGISSLNIPWDFLRKQGLDWIHLAQDSGQWLL
jgi:hypothetical protein